MNPIEVYYIIRAVGVLGYVGAILLVFGLINLLEWWNIKTLKNESCKEIKRKGRNGIILLILGLASLIINRFI